MAVVPSKLFADSSHRGIVERHVQCVLLNLSLVESCLSAVGYTLQ